MSWKTAEEEERDERARTCVGGAASVIEQLRGRTLGGAVDIALDLMKAPLARIAGMSLVDVDDSGDSYGFVFDGCTLVSFNPCRCSVPVRELVGAKASSVNFKPGKSMCVRFVGGGELAVSLAEADYKGPEAFAVHFSDGSIVAV